MSNNITDLFDSDPGLQYSEGDLVGICNDGVVRPMPYSSVVSYIGVVDSIEPDNKVSVILVGKKDCYVKTNTRDVMNLIGKKVIASKSENYFTIWDSTFDIDKKYDGIIIGNIYETARLGVVKATVLLK